MTTTQCLRGHDIAAVGRSAQRMCQECLRSWDRARNARRRADPAYRAAENAYTAAWWQFRGYSIALDRRIADGPAAMQRIIDGANAAFPGLGDTMAQLHPFDPPKPKPWNGDPHDTHAPKGAYRNRPGYPRVTRETVGEQAKKPYIQAQRRLARYPSTPHKPQETS